jgi:PAS domain S-box-containing protein
MPQSKHPTTYTNYSPSSQLGLFKDVWNAVECGMFVVEVLGDGEDFRHIAFNPAMAKILLIPIEEILGKTVTEVLGTQRGSICCQHYRECFLTGKVMSYEERLEFNGQVSFWSLTIAPIRNQEGAIHQMVVTAHDASIRKQAEAQVKEKEEFLLSIYDGCNNTIFVIDVLPNNQFVLVGCNAAKKL